MAKHETSSAEVMKKLENLRHRLDQIERGLDRVEDSCVEETDTVEDALMFDTVERSSDEVDWSNITELALQATGVVVIVIDPKERIIHFNQGAEQLTGFSAAEVHGKSIWKTLVLQEEVRHVQLTFAELRAGQPRNRHESTLLKRDGNRCLVSWTNVGVPDSTGILRYIVSSGFDVSERKRRGVESRQIGEIRARLDQLSPRETEVLRLVVAGKPNKIIALHLKISIKTVEHHRSNLMKKMRASSVAELVRMTMLTGWV